MNLSRRFLVLLLAGAAIVAWSPGVASAKTTTPVSGGTLTVAEFSEPNGLDPFVNQGFGTVGGIEMAAVYDTIMRYDAKTHKYDGETARSLTPNADASEWTLKLKPGIKFSDGTDYNADAVVFGVNRLRSGQPGAPPCAQTISCPSSTTAFANYAILIKDMTVIDPLTVKFTLNQPWGGFPIILTGSVGMIPSPAALKKCDPAAPPRNCAFNLKPVGAGPFMVDSFKVHESITMVRNPNYYGGHVYLDGLTFLTFNDGGGAKTLDALKVNQVQAAFLRAPDVVAAAHQGKLPGVSFLNQGGNIFLINTGAPVTCTGGQPASVCTGKPDGPTTTNSVTKDPTIRKAIVAAVSPQILYQRAFSGQGFPGKCLLQRDFPWYPNVACPKYDPTTAKKLVAQAKANGWDGTVRVICTNAPVSVNLCLAMQAMLQAAGMNPAIDDSKDTTGEALQVNIQHDYDVALSGLGIQSDDGAVLNIRASQGSASAGNRTGFHDPVFDQAINTALAAKTDAQKTAAYKTMMTELYANNPILPFGTAEEYIASTPKVHGIIGSAESNVLFAKAWMQPGG